MTHVESSVAMAGRKLASRVAEVSELAKKIKARAQHTQIVAQRKKAMKEAILASQEEKFNQLLGKAIKGVRNLIAFATRPEIHEMLKAYMYAREFERLDDGLTVFRVCIPTVFSDDHEVGFDNGTVHDILLTDMSILLREFVFTGCHDEDTSCTSMLEIPFSATESEIKILLTEGVYFIKPGNRNVTERRFEPFDFDWFRISPECYQSNHDLIQVSQKPQKDLKSIAGLSQQFFLQCAVPKKFNALMEHAVAGWSKKCEWHFDYRKYVEVDPLDIQTVRTWVAEQSVPYGAEWIRDEFVLMND